MEKRELIRTYLNTAVKSSDGKTIIKASGTVTKLNTGITTFTMAKNIYDLAGNCWEWTQDVNGTDNRATRGGNLYRNSYDYPASHRGGTHPTYNDGGNERYSCHINIESIILINIYI